MCGKNKKSTKFIYSAVGICGRGNVCKKCAEKVESTTGRGIYVIRKHRFGLEDRERYSIRWEGV